MGSLSLFHLTVGLIAVLVASALAGLVSSSRAGRAVLALRRFELYCQAQASEAPLIEIVGRRPGIIAFFLALAGLESQTTFRVTPLGVECRLAGLFGDIKRIVPLSRIASTTAGVRKPIGYLIVAGILLIVGPVVAIAMHATEVLAVCFVLIMVFVVAYFLSKQILLEVCSNAGLEISLRFKPSVLEGVPVDVNKALAAAEAIRDLVLGRQVATYEALASQQPSFSSEIVGEPDPAPSAGSWPPPVPTSQSPSPGMGTGSPDVSSNEEMATMALREAVQRYKAGQKGQAIEALRSVVSRFSGTKAAQTAQGYLKNLGR